MKDKFLTIGKAVVTVIVGVPLGFWCIYWVAKTVIIVGSMLPW